MTIKEIRKSTGLRQSKFANYFGISVRALQNWEINRVSPPPYLPGLLIRILELEKRVAELEGTERRENDFTISRLKWKVFLDFRCRNLTSAGCNAYHKDANKGQSGIPGCQTIDKDFFRRASYSRRPPFYKPVD